MAYYNDCTGPLAGNYTLVTEFVLSQQGIQSVQSQLVQVTGKDQKAVYPLIVLTRSVFQNGGKLIIQMFQC